MEFRVIFWDKYNDIHYGNWINCADRTIEELIEGREFMLRIVEKYEMEFRSVE